MLSTNVTHYLTIVGRTEKQIAKDIKYQMKAEPLQLALDRGLGPATMSTLEDYLVAKGEMQDPVTHPTENDRKRDQKPEIVMDEVFEPYGVEGRYVSRARIGLAEDIAKAKAAGEEAVRSTVTNGFLSAGAALKPGTASEGIVPSRGGGANGKPTTYEPHTGSYKPVAPKMGGLGVQPQADNSQQNAAVIFDTNAQMEFKRASALLKEGEYAVTTPTILLEHQRVAARKGWQVPKLALTLPVIEDSGSPALRLLIRDGVIEKNILTAIETNGKGLEAAKNNPGIRGMWGDGIIGATAITEGLSLVTADKKFYDAMKAINPSFDIRFLSPRK